MVALIYFIIYLSNIICIICLNSHNDSFINGILKRFIPNNKYQKILTNYNINIQIIENKNITNEFLINTTYKTKDFFFEFYYTGKFFYLNDNNLDLLSEEKNYKNQFILLIKSNNTLNNYISNNISLIKYLTKVIIVPKKAIPNFDIIARYCLKELYIYLIELDGNIFSQIINKYNNTYNNSKYYVKVLSKKYEVFPYIKLNTLLLIISLILFAFSFIYKYTLKKYEINLKERQINFFKDLQYYINEKFIILFFLYVELNIFYSYEGFIMDNSSFLRILTIFFMIINKAKIINFIINVFMVKE